MNKLFMWLLMAVSAIGFAGCIEVETEVMVNPDGTGTITVVTGMSSQMVDMMKGMMSGMGGEEGEEEEAPSFEETQRAEYAKNAQQFGEDVELTDFSTETKEGKMYFTAVYSFKDINKIKLASSAGIPEQGAAGEEEPQQFTFKFNKLEDKSVLSVTVPRNESLVEKGCQGCEGGCEECSKPCEGCEKGCKGCKKGETEEAEEAEEDDAETKQMEAMMKQMLGDMKISMRLVCGSEIIKTNATWREDNKITLLEMDFGSLLKDDTCMKKLTEIQKKYPEPPKDPAAMAQIMKDAGIEGLKIELNKLVEIEFK